jgi:hypothetical protein
MRVPADTLAHCAHFSMEEEKSLVRHYPYFYFRFAIDDLREHRTNVENVRADPFMKVLSEKGFWFYGVASMLSIIATFPFILSSYMCIRGGEYWPLILFVGIIIGMWFAAFGIFRKALDIKRLKSQSDDKRRNN